MGDKPLPNEGFSANEGKKHFSSQPVQKHTSEDAPQQYSPIATPKETIPESTPALEQVYEGYVKSVSDASVSIQLEVNDDLVLRRFRRDQLTLKKPIQAYDFARVTCTLEISPSEDSDAPEADRQKLREEEAWERKIRSEAERANRDSHEGA